MGCSMSQCGWPWELASAYKAVDRQGEGVRYLREKGTSTPVGPDKLGEAPLQRTCQGHVRTLFSAFPHRPEVQTALG